VLAAASYGPLGSLFESEFLRPTRAALKNTVGIGADGWGADFSNNFTSIPVTIT
jgi:hypothetical protein